MIDWILITEDLNRIENTLGWNMTRDGVSTKELP